MEAGVGASGNRTMTGYQTGTDNRLTSDGTFTYEYDKEGNRTTRINTTTYAVTEYTWDYHNRLTQVTEKDSMGTTTKVVEYTYDVLDRRIAEEVDTTSPFDMADAVIERYVYDDIHNGLASLDGSNVVLDFVDSDGAGTQPMQLAKRYLYGEAVDQILAQEDVTKNLSATDRVLWPLVDSLSTVRNLAKQDGTIAAHYRYDAYGNVTSGDTSLTWYLFTSRELDTDTGLQYNCARWYDPEVGRWVSEDPIGFLAGDGNVTRYVGNGVTFGRDPSGLWVGPLDPHASWNPGTRAKLWFGGVQPSPFLGMGARPPELGDLPGPGFYDDIYGTGETLSDPTTTIGQLVAGDIYGNQIWGDPGVGGSVSIPTPLPLISIGIGFEVIYDWGNDGRPGTGFHTYGYSQWGLSLGAPGSINFQHTFNFRPPNYTGRFEHVGGSIPLPEIGGGYYGVSRTPSGWDAIERGVPDTSPYTYYGGWAPGGSIQYQYQYYVLLSSTDKDASIPHAN